MDVDEKMDNEQSGQTSFSVLKDQISQATYHAIRRMNFETMTRIQAETIPAGLEGKDVVGSAKTGMNHGFELSDHSAS